ncbi:MAG: hypothetical protein ABI988_10200, partial [Nitrospirota bacterium]
EQRYGIKKQWLVNRLGLGCGVLCGLALSIKEKKVCISPGVAIDRYGREIVVPHEVCVDPWTLTDDCGRPQSPALSNTEAHEVYLCLSYKECQTDFMPVLVTDCNTKQECLPGTTVESYSVLVLKGAARPLPPMNEALCEILKSQLSESEKRKKLCELISGESFAVLGDKSICVVLGTVPLLANGTIDEGTVAEKKPDQCSGRTILVSNEHLLDMLLCLGAPSGGGGTTPNPSGLTHIESISRWTHDEERPLKQFPDKLEVVFSDVVTTIARNGRAWFVVTLELSGSGGGGGLGFEARAALTPSTSSIFATSIIIGGEVQLMTTKATFAVDQSFLDIVQAIPDPKTTITTTLRLLCRVIVKCDFLLDSKGKSIDGNHLGGVLPSGDGVPGGEFESWFWLTMTIDKPPPTVSSSDRADSDPTNTSTVHFTVTFSEDVTGVDTGAFSLTTTGTITGASVTGISGGPKIYTVTVGIGTGTGTIRLDVSNTATAKDRAGNALSDLPFISGEAYTIL